uniref:Uncharacterized protein n=1 Tax=Cacopsylla melanoneura TaxID=428564 RepID=A0A8D8UPF4_9HEMI
MTKTLAHPPSIPALVMISSHRCMCHPPLGRRNPRSRSVGMMMKIVLRTGQETTVMICLPLSYLLVKALRYPRQSRIPTSQISVPEWVLTLRAVPLAVVQAVAVQVPVLL